MLRLAGLSLIFTLAFAVASHADTELGLRSDDFALQQSEDNAVQHRLLMPRHGVRPSDHLDHQRPVVWYGNGLLWPRSFESGEVGIAHADTIKSEKKTRQKKREPIPRDQQKEPETQAVSDEDDDDESSTECFGGCLFLFFESLCGSSSDSDADQLTTTTTTFEEGSQVAPAGETVGPATAAVPIALPYTGVLKPLNPYSSDINLWDIPGGAAAGGQVVAELTRNSPVNVVEREDYNNTEWVRVQGEGVPEPGGWIQEREVSSGGEDSVYDQTGVAATGDPARSFPDVKDARWEILADLSYPMFGNSMIREEYKSSFRVGAETRFLFVHSIQLDLSFGYSHSNGDPQYDYVTSTTRESPVDSDLDIWSIGARVGQLFGVPTSYGYFFFSYDLGPTVFNVSERATLEIYEGRDLTGARKDELSESEIGAEAKVEFTGVIDGKFSIGAHTRFSWIPWDANEEKSLTLDYLNDDSIYVFNFGISIGYMFY